ncbi:P-loop containing nucleoside triphosphate hydrolase protein, partial [Leptodontidium sp. 2 PMI_412]
FMPSYGTRLFWYQGNLLLFIRTAEETGFGHIQIKCFGRQPSIIKHFLLHVLNHQRIASHTRTYYPKFESGKLHWKLTSSRRRRPMSTVMFDETEKEKLTKDVKEFFDPAMEDWYSCRSIPYRRGYLFHGPPGTGKTSLCYAIAGETELDVYVLSLSNTDLGENTIISCLNLLPSRCLLLLEDIDAVGISRDLTQSQVKPGPKPISLSTLLNILDGSLAHCGSITCATTNFPDRLDAALVRTGRVDYKVPFTIANRAVVAGVFSSMFTFPKDNSPIDIEDLAKQFAAKIPEFMFTAAEVQGYLLGHKYDPMRAVNMAEDWVCNRNGKALHTTESEGSLVGGGGC